MDSRWVQWHGDYDDPASSLSRRLAVVRDQLRRTLDERRVARLISMCAGDGRDVLPVLAEQGRDVDALLVELDPALAERARHHALELGLDRVIVRTTDAGITDAYLGGGAAQLVLACGVFGNITLGDAAATIAALPTLLDQNGTVIWTRGRGDEGPDPSDDIRRLFTEHGFEELSFTAPQDARFRVGVHRLVADPVAFETNRRLFRFV